MSNHVIVNKSSVYSHLTETNIIGILINEVKSRHVIFDIVKSSKSFTNYKHALLFDTIKHLYTSGYNVDLISITEHLRSIGELEDIGGAYYITTLSVNVTSTDVTRDCLILQEMYIKRELASLTQKFLAESLSEESDSLDLLNDMEMELSAIKNYISGAPIESFRNVMQNYFDRLNQIIESDGSSSGIKTPFDKLTNLLDGWRQSDLIVVGARPSVGKTAFALQTAYNCLKDNNKGGAVLFFSLEMNINSLIDRLIARQISQGMASFRRENIKSDTIYQEVTEAVKMYSKLDLYIEDNIYDLNGIVAKSTQMVAKHGIKMIIIDYYQLISTHGKDTTAKLEEISRALKLMAKKLNVPVIVLAQLNKESKDGEPNTSDFRFSEALNNDADVIIFLWHKDVERGVRGLAVKKHRNGELLFGDNSLSLSFDGAKQEFVDIDNYTTFSASDLLMT